MSILTMPSQSRLRRRPSHCRAAYAFACLAGLSVAAPLGAQTPVTPAELMSERGVDFGAIEITVETMGPGLYVLFGSGGNIAVSSGEEGVLIVDDQFAALAPKIRSAIQSLGGRNPDFVINTHWHYDHTDGNPVFGSSGSWIVAQANARRMLTESQLVNLVVAVVRQAPSPAVGLPVITFEDRLSFHFNDEVIDLLHFGPAHTTGDTAVVFRQHNAVHMGDVFNNAGYPFIDADNGGSIDGVIAFCESVLQELDADTRVIPGHGPVASRDDLRAYVEMLRTVRERITALIENGATLEQVLAARPTAEWDAARGDPLRLVDRAYASLQR
jgi:cyclase